MAFSTVPELLTAYQSEKSHETVELLRDDQLSPLFQAVRDVTEEAVINSMLQAVTTTGHRGRTVEAIDPMRVIEVGKKYGLNAANKNTGDKVSGVLMSSPRTYGDKVPSTSLASRIDQLPVGIYFASPASSISAK